MKTLNWIAWISAAIGIVFVLIGVIQSVFEQFLPGGHIINYYLASDSFFLLTIVLFVYQIKCQCKKE